LDTSIFWLVVIAAAWALSFGVAFAVRANAGRLKLVQTPNERSSHVRPTPSGGGIGIAVAGSVAGIVVSLQTGSAGWSVLVATFCIAILGLLDDVHNLSSRLRFGLQMVFIGAILFYAGEMPAIELSTGRLPSIVLYPALLFLAVWWVNLFNFMDGIDGLAGSESIVLLAGAGALIFAVAPGAMTDAMWWWGLIVAGATLGFLVQNWPPAKVFMGDAGSNYLALFILGFALHTISRGWLSYTSWAVLAALFVTDASVTLVRRIIGQERWLAAHRQHAYQILSRRWKSHKTVTLLYLCVNIFWLLPLSFLTLKVPGFAWAALLAAYAPLILGVALVGAGTPDRVR
jgi:Fuc2NAc and GlcNAc transferase